MFSSRCTQSGHPESADHHRLSGHFHDTLAPPNSGRSGGQVPVPGTCPTSISSAADLFDPSLSPHLSRGDPPVSHLRLRHLADPHAAEHPSTGTDLLGHGWPVWHRPSSCTAVTTSQARESELIRPKSFGFWWTRMRALKVLPACNNLCSLPHASGILKTSIDAKIRIADEDGDANMFLPCRSQP